MTGVARNFITKACSSCGGALEPVSTRKVRCTSCGRTASLPKSLRTTDASLRDNASEVERANELWQSLDRNRISDRAQLALTALAPLTFFGGLAASAAWRLLGHVEASQLVLLYVVIVPMVPAFTAYSIASVWNSRSRSVLQARVTFARHDGTRSCCRQCGAPLAHTTIECFVRCSHCQTLSLAVLSADGLASVAVATASTKAAALDTLSELEDRVRKTRFAAWYAPLTLGLFAAPFALRLGLARTLGPQAWDVTTFFAALIWPVVEVVVPGNALEEIQARLTGRPVDPGIEERLLRLGVVAAGLCGALLLWLVFPPFV